MLIDAEKLRRQMFLRGFTPKLLAQAAHLSVQTVQNILRNKTFEPQFSTETRLVMALNCSRYDIAKSSNF